MPTFVSKNGVEFDYQDDFTGKLVITENYHAVHGDTLERSVIVDAQDVFSFIGHMMETIYKKSEENIAKGTQ